MIHIKKVKNSDFENPIDIIVIKHPKSVHTDDFKVQANYLSIELPTDRITVIDYLFLTGPTSKLRFNILYPNGEIMSGIQMLSNSGVGDLSNRVIDELLEHHWTFTMFESNLTRFEKLKYIDLYEQRLKNVDKASRFINKPLIHVNTEVSSGFHSPIIKWYETYELTINNTFVVRSFSAPYKDRLDDVTAWKLKQIPEEDVFCEKFSFTSLDEANTQLTKLSKGNLEPAIDDHTPFLLLKR